MAEATPSHTMLRTTITQHQALAFTAGTEAFSVAVSAAIVVSGEDVTSEAVTVSVEIASVVDTVAIVTKGKSLA